MSMLDLTGINPKSKRLNLFDLAILHVNSHGCIMLQLFATYTITQ
jgi:hypothetical protein